jgi:hypothetical protein
LICGGYDPKAAAAARLLLPPEASPESTPTLLKSYSTPPSRRAEDTVAFSRLGAGFKSLTLNLMMYKVCYPQ